MTTLNTRLSVALLVLLAPFALRMEAAPTIEATPAGLRATGVTAGGDAVWFGLTADSFAMTPRITRHAAVVRDSDGDGIVLYEMPEISHFTLVFVADAATGAYAVFRGDGVDAVDHDLRGNPWRVGLEHFDIPADYIEILLVRPGGGAWTISTMEGQAKDADGARNSKFRLRVENMDPIDPEAPPAQANVRHGDLLIVVDPLSFRYAIRTAID